MGEGQRNVGRVVLEKSASQELDYRQARGILGKERAISARMAHNAWGIHDVAQGYRVLYLEETLRQCARENARGTADWWLMFLFSLDIVRVLGMLPRMRIALGEAWKQYLLSQADGKGRPRTGYHLCNRMSVPSVLPHEERRKELLAIDQQYSIARVVELTQILAVATRFEPGICDDQVYVSKFSKRSMVFQLALNHGILNLGIPAPDSCSVSGIVPMRRWELTPTN